MLVESMGTPYEIQTEETILFIEDVAEKPFRIDRMLMQFHLGGMLNRYAVLSLERCWIACRRKARITLCSR